MAGHSSEAEIRIRPNYARQTVRRDGETLHERLRVGLGEEMT